MKFSAATASCLLRTDPLIMRNWKAKLAVSEDACRKYFSKLTGTKKKANAASAAVERAKKDKGHAKNVSEGIAASLGLNADGSALQEDLIEVDDSNDDIVIPLFMPI